MKLPKFFKKKEKKPEATYNVLENLNVKDFAWKICRIPKLPNPTYKVLQRIEGVSDTEKITSEEIEIFPGIRAYRLRLNPKQRFFYSHNPIHNRTAVANGFCVEHTLGDFHRKILASTPDFQEFWEGKI
jgi:hypothetical protein